MKKFISLATVSMAALLFTACNGGETKGNNSAKTDATVTPDVKTRCYYSSYYRVKTEVKTD
jgi:hypothetical protein